MKANAISEPRVHFGPVQIGIVLLTILTAVIHLTLAFIAPDPMFTPLFILNGVVYLALLAGLFLPLPFARDHRDLVRWALTGFAAATILGWLILGDKSLPSGMVGYITKAIEILLIVLLFIDRK